MKKIFALLLCLVPASWARAAEPVTAEPTLMGEAVAAIKPKPSWERIELKEETPTRYLLTL
jgi:hypothetical protein